MLSGVGFPFVVRYRTMNGKPISLKRSELSDGLFKPPTIEEAMSDLNDPRVFFAAERTLLAWSRTSITVMVFGFVVERFGLLAKMLLPRGSEIIERSISFWVGLIFILFGVALSVVSTIQYLRVLRTLRREEIPEGYWRNLGVVTNFMLGVLGLLVAVYLIIELR
jgi:putative membrane protein